MWNIYIDIKCLVQTYDGDDNMRKQGKWWQQDINEFQSN